MMPALGGMVRAAPSWPSSSPMASGTIGAPSRPCTTRAAMSSPMLGTTAHAAEASTKPASAAW